MKAKFVYLFYVVLCVVMSIFTLNFNYIDGDDATTILHHALGGDIAIQKAYAPYHGMFDTLLQLVSSSNESTLRISAILMSFFASFIILICIAYIIFKLIPEEYHRKTSFGLVLLPFILPEMLWSGLIVNPSNISFALLLLAHICLLFYFKKKSIKYLIIAILLFGLGVSFRWSNGFYIFVLFGHYIYSPSTNIRKIISWKQIKSAIVIFPFFILSVLLWIYISGYSVADIMSVYTSGASYLEETETSLLALAASGIPFITPALVLMTGLGIFFLLKRRIYIPIYLLLFAILPYFLLGVYPMYKYMIVVILPLSMISVYGFVSLKSNFMKVTVLLVIILPWIIGVQIKSDSVWGPGFELTTKEKPAGDINNFNPDNAISIKNSTIVIGSGMAVPTPEGPRSVYGFGSVFLKDWKRFLSKITIEREAAVNVATETETSILQDVNHSFIATKLLTSGYNTSDPMDTKNEFGLYRKFSNNEQSLYIQVFDSKNKLFDKKYMSRYLKSNNSVVIYSSYTNIIPKMKALYGSDFEQKGAYWGILQSSSN